MQVAQEIIIAPNTGRAFDVEQRRRFRSCIHALAIGLILDGAGQLVGYAAGIGRAVDQVARFEFHRLRHIRDDDRRDLSLA